MCGDPDMGRTDKCASQDRDMIGRYNLVVVVGWYSIDFWGANK